jgi:hypothetical protein
MSIAANAPLSFLKLRRSAMVRLQTHSHCGVEVPVRPKIHRPVTEGYCVVVTRGGELPEVNCQSVTRPEQSEGKVNSIQQVDGMRLSCQSEICAAAQALGQGFLREQERPAAQRACAEQNSESQERPRRHQSVKGDRMAGSVSEPSRETHWGQTVFMASGPKSRPVGVRAFIVARKRLTRAEPRNAGRWNR